MLFVPAVAVNVTLVPLSTVSPVLSSVEPAFAVTVPEPVPPYPNLTANDFVVEPAFETVTYFSTGSKVIVISC